MQLSLCCQSNKLINEGVKYRRMTVTQFKKKTLQESSEILSSRIIENFVALKATVELCVKMNISGLRIGSDLIPVINHPDLNLNFYDLPNQDGIMSSINAAKQAMYESNLRFSSHPSEYVSLTSDNESVIANSVRDLEAHAFLFDLLGLPESYEAPLNIHIRKDGDPQIIASTVIKNIKKCSDKVRKRLVFENNDNRNGTWSIKRLISHVHAQTGIPITFDTLHHQMLPDGLSEKQAFEAAYCTWPSYTIPIFHYSEGINNTRKHAEYATGLPPDYGMPVIWEVELKAKDLAIKKMLQKIKNQLI